MMRTVSATDCELHGPSMMAWAPRAVLGRATKLSIEGSQRQYCRKPRKLHYPMTSQLLPLRPPPFPSVHLQVHILRSSRNRRAAVRAETAINSSEELLDRLWLVWLAWLHT
jgi:hypothetical protein